MCRIDNLETTKRGLNGLTFDNPNNPMTKNKNIILTATIIQIINGFYIHKTQMCTLSHVSQESDILRFNGIQWRITIFSKELKYIYKYIILKILTSALIVSKNRRFFVAVIIIIIIIIIIIGESIW